MEITYEFSIAAAIVGVLIIAVGALVVRYYNKISDIVTIGNYSTWRLVGFITIGIGFLVMLNIHTLILKAIIYAILSY